MNEIKEIVERLESNRNLSDLVQGLTNLIEQLQTKITARSGVLQDNNPETYDKAATEVVMCLQLMQVAKDTKAKLLKIDESVVRIMKRLARTLS